MDQAKKVLLIEDEVFISDLYKRILNDAGIMVEEALDGKEGLQKAKEAGVGLILLDIMLPGLNGIEVLRKLKSETATSSIPIVLLTNLGQKSVVKTAFDSGAQGYLLKVKTSPAALVKCVRDFLRNPRLKVNFDTLDLD